MNLLRSIFSSSNQAQQQKTGSWELVSAKRLYENIEINFDFAENIIKSIHAIPAQRITINKEPNACGTVNYSLFDPASMSYFSRLKNVVSNSLKSECDEVIDALDNSSFSFITYLYGINSILKPTSAELSPGNILSGGGIKGSSSEIELAEFPEEITKTFEFSSREKIPAGIAEYSEDEESKSSEIPAKNETKSLEINSERKDDLGNVSLETLEREEMEEPKVIPPQPLTREDIIDYHSKLKVLKQSVENMWQTGLKNFMSTYGLIEEEDLKEIKKEGDSPHTERAIKLYDISFHMLDAIKDSFKSIEEFYKKNTQLFPEFLSEDSKTMDDLEVTKFEVIDCDENEWIEVKDSNQPSFHLTKTISSSEIKLFEAFTIEEISFRKLIDEATLEQKKIIMILLDRVYGKNRDSELGFNVQSEEYRLGSEVLVNGKNFVDAMMTIKFRGKADSNKAWLLELLNKYVS